MTYTLKIIQDNNSESPREWDNLGTIVVSNNYRYNFADICKDVGYIEELAADKDKDNITLPVYIYDHSGITINTTGFSCPWDSGQVGIIYVSKEKIRSEYGWKYITKGRRFKILEYLKNEVTTLDQWLTGDVWGFKLYENGEEINSCWSYYGSDPHTNGMFEHLTKEQRENLTIEMEY